MLLAIDNLLLKMIATPATINTSSNTTTSRKPCFRTSRKLCSCMRGSLPTEEKVSTFAAQVIRIAIIRIRSIRSIASSAPGLSSRILLILFI